MRKILPERVFGSAVTMSACFNHARVPISSRQTDRALPLLAHCDWTRLASAKLEYVGQRLAWSSSAGLRIAGGWLPDPDEQLRHAALAGQPADDFVARSEFGHVGEDAGGQSGDCALEQDGRQRL